MEATEKFLRDYLNSCAPPGKENSCSDLWVRYLEPFSDHIVRDSYGSVAAIQGDGPGSVSLEAHSDEIAWLVNYISPDGYIYVVKSGGSDPTIAPSKKVMLFGRKGRVPGIFAWPSSSQRLKNDNEPTTPNLFIDVGCSSKEEVRRLGIDVGDPVLFDERMTILNDRLYTGRALDNRIGGFIVAEVARRVRTAEQRPAFTLSTLNCVQEEVGLRGAQMMAHRLTPDLAIVVDVVNDTNTPRNSKTQMGDIAVGRGPVLVTAPPIHRSLLDKLAATACDHGITFQRMAMSRSTGTDADAFAYSGSGIPTALVCIPLKYMHTTVESVDKRDVAAAIELLFHFIVSLDLHEFESHGMFGSNRIAPGFAEPVTS